MESFRDKNEGAYRSAEAGTGELLGDPGSELRVGREKEKEKSEDTMDKHKKKIRQGLTYCHTSGQARFWIFYQELLKTGIYNHRFFYRDKHAWSYPPQSLNPGAVPCSQQDIVIGGKANRSPTVDIALDNSAAAVPRLLQPGSSRLR